MTDDGTVAGTDGADVGCDMSDASADTTEGSPDAYDGVFGAFPYALRSSDSLLFASYVVGGGLLALAVAALFGLSLVVLIGSTAAVAGGTFTFSRAFVVLVGLFTVAPLVAPVLFVARRHRRGTSTWRYDTIMAILGYLFVCSLLVALIISAPPALRDPPAGVFAPLIRFLYHLPRLAGLVPPLFVAILIWTFGRREG